jgi:hypothetical protein
MRRVSWRYRSQWSSLPLGLEVEPAEREPKRLVGQREGIDSAALRVHDEWLAFEVEVPALDVDDATAAKPVAKEERRATANRLGQARELRGRDPVPGTNRPRRVGRGRTAKKRRVLEEFIHDPNFFPAPLTLPAPPGWPEPDQTKAGEHREVGVKLNLFPCGPNSSSFIDNTPRRARPQGSRPALTCFLPRLKRLSGARLFVRTRGRLLSRALSHLFEICDETRWLLRQPRLLAKLRGDLGDILRGIIRREDGRLRG